MLCVLSYRLSQAKAFCERNGLKNSDVKIIRRSKELRSVKRVVIVLLN